MHGEVRSEVFFSYDEHGHMRDWLTLDGAGKQEAHTPVITNKDGNNTEQWDWGKEDQLLLHVRHSFGLQTKTERFDSFALSVV